MSRERLSLQALPAWMSINDATFTSVEVKPINNKGNGLIVQKDSDEVGDSPLLTIPHDLVLNCEAVHEYAKEDKNFSQLLDACGHKLLDDEVPVPTLWKESERILLQGTSLESALNAKMTALAHEFDEMREMSSDIEYWNAAFWDSRAVHLTDWYLVDAWYRSRVLELPNSGPSLVPCIDMANHSNDANAYYEENAKDEIILLLRPDSNVEGGGEVTISYGSEKSAAEMLFSYGFIDESSTAKSLRLPLSPLPDDPLARAKAHVFEDALTIDIKETDGKMIWKSPFAYLMVLNEEDGLDFKVLQDKDGGRELRMFWRDEDVSDKSGSFETLISAHELCDVFNLRVNMVIYQRVQEQLENLSLPLPDDNTDASEADGVDSSNASNARALRRTETKILERVISTLEEQRSELVALESVTAYLESMTVSEGAADEAHEATDDDFS